MTQMNLADAKAHLSQLVDEALRGEEVVIARAGSPMVRLVPVDRSHRSLGFLDADLPDGFFFDGATDEELDEWE